MDALGVETSGTLAQLALPEAGAELTAGRPSASWRRSSSWAR